ncbi:Beta-glucosidase A [compost metagenome]
MKASRGRSATRSFGKFLGALGMLAVLAGCGGPGAFGWLGDNAKLRIQSVPGSDQAFPSGFLWGVATAGYQYEGGDSTSQWAAWERSGRGKHRIGQATDHWNRWEEDLDLAKDLGLNAFRLSIEWARIEPERGRIDPEAVRHYHQVIDGLRARGMEPIVTLVHFAYPAWLDRPLSGGDGGWESDETVTEFRRYAAWAAQEFGPKVRWWITLNEPNTAGLTGYVAGVHPPGKRNPFAYAQVMERMAKAHQAGFDALHAHDPDAQVSINPFIFHRRQTSPKYETQASTDLNDFSLLDRLAPVSDPDGTPRSKTEKRYLDYVAFDYYYALGIWDVTKIGTFWEWPIYPEGMYEVSKKLYERYRLPLFVAENGFATEADNPRKDGWNREAFLVNHLAQLRKAMAEGVPVLGYMHWSLSDNYEWGTYTPKFGLYGIDRRDPELRRFKTGGAEVYRQIASSNRLPESLLSRYLGRRN